MIKVCLIFNLATNHMIFPFSDSLNLFLILLIRTIKLREKVEISSN